MLDEHGTVAWSAEIGVWGQLRGLEGDRAACPFRWPGQYEDVETGLYYNRFRYYDPEAGQYASRDPIGLAGGAALYAYVKDPATWSDPLGLTGCDRSKIRDDKQGRWRDERGRFSKHPGWPDNYGFQPGSDSVAALLPGHRVDRYGHPGGEFVADMGTPFEQRALPASSALREYRTYEVAKPIPEVRSGPAAPWFGQPGMGQQHQLPQSVQTLVDTGYLKELP